MSETDFSGATEEVHCESCSATCVAGQRFCTSCGFPIQGTEEEKGHFRTRISNAKYLLADANKKTRRAKTIILVLAGLSIFFGLVLGFGSDDFGSMVTFLFMGLLYLVLAYWCDRNPFGAILTAFIVYLTVHAVDFFLDPSSLAKGLILKIFFIAAFITGIRAAREAQQYHESLKKAKAIKDENA